MRALGSLLLLTAQLRPVAGIVLCALVGPTGTADAMASCDDAQMPPMEQSHLPPGDHSRWDQADAMPTLACPLAEICRPATPSQLGPAIALGTPDRYPAIPVTGPVTVSGPESSAPPTPPPNS